MNLGSTFADDAPMGEPSPEERAELDEPLSRPLSDVDTDELFAEIAMRYRRYVFVGEESVNDQTHQVWKRYKGSHTEQVGLAQRLLWILHQYEWE